MEMIVQIAISDLVSRLISRVIHTYQERENVGQKLRRMHLTLTSIHASVEEAKQRLITNQLILLQLNAFMDVVWQAYYLIDSFESEDTEENSGHDEVRNAYSFSLSNPCKRVCRMSDCVKRLLRGDMSKLQEVMGLLEAVAANLRQFDALVAGYPRRPRQPYDSYMCADKCMFGRHVEREQIINFLFEKDDDFATQTLPVLPIIGRHRSGKKTLMENVCSDQRVRSHFSLIFLLDGDDLEGEMLEAPFLACREGVIITNHDLQLKKCLLVIEFAFIVDVESWTIFYNRVNNLMKGTGSKIMIISSLTEAARLGTTSPITLVTLPPEQFWYFFKAIAFGSANPKEHPKLLSLGMQVADATGAAFVRAQLYGRALRENLDANAWSAILRYVRKAQRGHAYHRRSQRVISLHTISGSEASHSCIFKRSRMDVANGKLPELSLYDLRSPQVAEIPPGEKFEVVKFRSFLPPFRIFVGTYVTLDALAVKTRLFVSNETLDDMEEKMFRFY
ncbi:unnamed protein product [Urochloa decumbens]|uniref:Disease resistance N-terminal domain-containing protein n=1 Tax=Urochloa decumbens TaxID=240449 RepID=A0ABC9BJM3_9POAL